MMTATADRHSAGHLIPFGLVQEYRSWGVDRHASHLPGARWLLPEIGINIRI